MMDIKENNMIIQHQQEKESEDRCDKDDDSLISTGSESKRKRNESDMVQNELDNTDTIISVIDHEAASGCLQAEDSESTKRDRYRGVYWCKTHKTWRARIIVDNRRKHIGYFKSAVDAARAYDMRAKAELGEHAMLNFPGNQIKPVPDVLPLPKRKRRRKSTEANDVRQSEKMQKTKSSNSLILSSPLADSGGGMSYNQMFSITLGKQTNNLVLNGTNPYAFNTALPQYNLNWSPHGISNPYLLLSPRSEFFQLPLPSPTTSSLTQIVIPSTFNQNVGMQEFPHVQNNIPRSLFHNIGR